MQAYLTLTRRELAGFFVSMTGYVIIAGAVFLMGMSFVDLLVLLQGEPTPVPVTQLFYSTDYFWGILLLAAPVITMRLFALEKYSGTFETLMTTPVSDLQVVLAKFTAAMIFFMLMWLPSTRSHLDSAPLHQQCRRCLTPGCSAARSWAFSCWAACSCRSAVLPPP